MYSKEVLLCMQNIQILNKTQINLEDRRKAELDYIRHNWKAYLSASVLESELINDQIQRFKTLHPRYLQLLQSEYMYCFLSSMNKEGGEERIYKLKIQVMYRYYSPTLLLDEEYPQIVNLFLWATLVRTIHSKNVFFILYVMKMKKCIMVNN